MSGNLRRRQPFPANIKALRHTRKTVRLSLAAHMAPKGVMDKTDVETETVMLEWLLLDETARLLVHQIREKTK